MNQPPKRRTTAAATESAPKGRRSKLARENEITAEQEVEIREAWGMFSQPKERLKEGVLPMGDMRRFFMYATSQTLITSAHLPPCRIASAVKGVRLII